MTLLDDEPRWLYVLMHCATCNAQTTMMCSECQTFICPKCQRPHELVCWGESREDQKRRKNGWPTLRG